MVGVVAGVEPASIGALPIGLRAPCGYLSRVFATKLFPSSPLSFATPQNIPLRAPAQTGAECWFSVVTVTCYITPPIRCAASRRVAAASQELSKCFGDWMAGADLRHKALFRRLELTYLLSYPRESVTSPCASACAFTQSQNIPCIGQRQLSASVARSHAVLALARGYSLTDRIAPGDTARLRVGVLTGH